MQNQILDLFGILRSEYVHAHGRASTDLLIQKLDCNPSERILEIGVGTGTTMALLASNYRRTNFYGTDLSSLMLTTAQKRISFCGLSSNTQLHLQKNESCVSFENDFFEKVYVESVLGIQEGDELKHWLVELFRILKPGGKLIMNETIWLESTSKETANKVNKKCKAAFGIIQSNIDCLHVDNWKSVLSKLGFTDIEALNLDGSEVENRVTFPIYSGLRSKLFSGIGKLKIWLNPTVNRQWRHQSNRMTTIMSDRPKLMNGFLISCKKG
jgi:ubiquinone/menaquinone biosynthesis C-methylase UbiE